MSTILIKTVLAILAGIVALTSQAIAATPMSTAQLALYQGADGKKILVAKQKGAPIEWRPLEPVVTTVGYSGLTVKAPNPHVALLFLNLSIQEQASN